MTVENPVFFCYIMAFSVRCNAQSLPFSVVMRNIKIECFKWIKNFAAKVKSITDSEHFLKWNIDMYNKNEYLGWMDLNSFMKTVIHYWSREPTRNEQIIDNINYLIQIGKILLKVRLYKILLISVILRLSL